MTTLKTTLASLLLVILPEIFSCSKDTELSENKKQSEIKNNLNNIEHNESAQILILGGGYSASGNQISLESNVKYFQRIKPILQLEEKSLTPILRTEMIQGETFSFLTLNLLYLKLTKLWPSFSANRMGLPINTAQTV